LREPLESGVIHISRAACQAEFPANFQLVGRDESLPLRLFRKPFSKCACSPEKIKRYLSKLSGPFLDRIDMHIEVPFYRGIPYSPPSK